MNCERDEEMLTRGLQSLAAEMEPLEAPHEIEANLLEAFRARQIVSVRKSPFVRFNPRPQYWLAAIAAMLLIAIGIVAYRWSNRPANGPSEAVRREQPQPQPTVNDKSNEQLVQAVEKPQHSQSKRVHRVSSRRADSAQVANHATKEIATDFFPLSYMSAASLQDGGQIVRVQLPRSALANFGLPVNMDRYNEKVKADVLVGVDGMARAIRFVQ
jgi:hypothetical protein